MQWPHPSVFTTAHCVSCRDAHFELSSVVIRFCFAEYARKRLSWISPLKSPKWGFLGLSPLWDEMYRWDHQKTHPWPKPRRLMYHMWNSSAQGRLWACPRSPRKKTPPTDNFTYMGSRDPPADHYERWPAWWSRQRNQLFKFLLGSVKGFLFCEVLKMAISYT
jgi:hypothetical protein